MSLLGDHPISSQVYVTINVLVEGYNRTRKFALYLGGRGDSDMSMQTHTPILLLFEQELLKAILSIKSNDLLKFLLGSILVSSFNQFKLRCCIYQQMMTACQATWPFNDHGQNYWDTFQAGFQSFPSLLPTIPSSVPFSFPSSMLRKAIHTISFSDQS